MTVSPTPAPAGSCTASNSPCVLTSFTPDERVEGHHLGICIDDLPAPRWFRESHTVVRSETAEYLPPISLGQPGAQQGSSMNGSCAFATPNYDTNAACNPPTSGLGSSGTTTTSSARRDGVTHAPKATRSRRRRPNRNGCGTGAATRAAQHPRLTSTDQPGSRHRDPVSDAQLPGRVQLPDTDPCRSVSRRAGLQPRVRRLTRAVPAVVTSGVLLPRRRRRLPGSAAPYTSYSAMVYTLFKVSTLSSRLSDQLVSQEVFYPYNATDAVSGGTAAASITLLSALPRMQPPSSTRRHIVPTTYHQWVSAVNYAPTSATDVALFGDPDRFWQQLPDRPVGDRTSVLPPRGRHHALEWPAHLHVVRTCTIPSTERAHCRGAQGLRGASRLGCRQSRVLSRDTRRTRAAPPTRCGVPDNYADLRHHLVDG